jgi:hypothetical protein
MLDIQYSNSETKHILNMRSHSCVLVSSLRGDLHLTFLSTRRVHDLMKDKVDSGLKLPDLEHLGATGGAYIVV